MGSPNKTSSQPNYITDSDDEHTKISTSPTQNHQSTNKYSPSPSTNIINSFQQHFSPTPSESSSFPPNADPFNYDHPHQYEQGYYDGVEQERYQQESSDYSITNDDLHTAYGQGRYDEYHQ